MRRLFNADSMRQQFVCQTTADARVLSFGVFTPTIGGCALGPIGVCRRDNGQVDGFTAWQS
jgi:hypothetical protein